MTTNLTSRVVDFDSQTTSYRAGSSIPEVHDGKIPELSSEKIQGIMEKASSLDQLVIIKDLLMASGDGETQDQKNMASLAARLFMTKPSFQIQQQLVFDIRLRRDKRLSVNFALALRPYALKEDGVDTSDSHQLLALSTINSIV